MTESSPGMTWALHANGTAVTTGYHLQTTFATDAAILASSPTVAAGAMAGGENSTAIPTTVLNNITSLKNLTRASYDPGLELSVGSSVALALSMIGCTVVTILANLTVILVIAFTRRLHTVTSAFLVNLAASDLMVGVGVMPVVTSNVVNDGWAYGQPVCKVVGFVTLLSCISSVLTLAAIALDRYNAIINCLKYHTDATSKKTARNLLWIWLQALACSAPPLLGWGGYAYSKSRFACSADWTRTMSYTLFVAVTCFLLPAIVVIVCYARIVKVARDHARRITDVRENLNANNSSQEDFTTVRYIIPAVSIIGDLPSFCTFNPAVPAEPDSISLASNDRHPAPSQARAAYRLFVLIFVYFCCWTPYVVVHLNELFHKHEGPSWSHPTPPWVFTMATWLALSNSMVNPLIYAFRSRKFRNSLRRLWRKLRNENVQPENRRTMETVANRRRVSTISSASTYLTMLRSQSSTPPTQGVGSPSPFPALQSVGEDSVFEDSNSNKSNTLSPNVHQVIVRSRSCAADVLVSPPGGGANDVPLAELRRSSVPTPTAMFLEVPRAPAMLPPLRQEKLPPHVADRGDSVSLDSNKCAVMLRIDSASESSLGSRVSLASGGQNLAVSKETSRSKVRNSKTAKA
ncbi:5-hydroxytryptamine receptor 1D-like [Branchiostoma floridae]|uniref:5-hydroxytryptamine receptor 1D-like n=1 Tax=Branchiostoma floridae TaxID=7739 RepID=A0A9J7LHP4_BRAFL|nr:5-hydroxytryptamine receptor 1D-like [Branchiostoma floridae]